MARGIAKGLLAIAGLIAFVFAATRVEFIYAGF
jgi:hypothetical protein